MNVRAKVSITREGWYYLGMLGFIIAGAVIRDINLLYIMAGMMLGPLLFSLIASTRSLRRLRAMRGFHPLVSVGDPLCVEIDVTRPAGSTPAYAVVVRDHIRRQGDRRARASTTVFFSCVPAAGAARCSYKARLHHRGRYYLGPMNISTSMPLGLVRATATLDRRERVLVTPQLGTLHPTWARQVDLKNNGSQKSRRRRGQSEGDFYGMREWRNGDSRNRIHWRTSAKRGKLTVRQFEQRINQDLVVILDLWQPDREPTQTYHIESAVSFAATLIVHQTTKGASHLLVASASESGFVAQGIASPVLQQELMEHLAVVMPSPADTLPDVIASVLPKAKTNAKIILVSPHERNLRDTDLFEALWRQTSSRRSVNDILKVNTASPQFSEVFLPANVANFVAPSSNPHRPRVSA